MPPALPGECAFASSGTCLTAALRGEGREGEGGEGGGGKGGGDHLYLGSGGVDPGRVFRTADEGRTWQVAPSAIAGGPTAGVYSVRFWGRQGIAVGGDYTLPNGTAGRPTASWSSDGGATWTAAEGLVAYRSGCAWVPGGGGTDDNAVAVAVGPTGSDVSVDGGRSWRPLTKDGPSFDAVQCPSDRMCWASGPRGRVGRLFLRDTDLGPRRFAPPSPPLA